MPQSDTYDVTARWEHGFSVSLTFTTSRAAFSFLRALYETPRSPFRITSAKAHRIDARGEVWDCSLPFCNPEGWFYGNGEPVPEGELPDYIPRG
jgi:hypothetical protein